MSWGTVTIWHPHSSAWKMFSTSRTLAQSNSAFGRSVEQRPACAHQWHRIAAGIGDATGENGHHGGHGGIERGGDVPNLGQGENGRDIELHPLRRQLADQRDR